MGGYDAGGPPAIDPDFSVTRPENTVTFIMTLALLLGASISVNCGWGWTRWRQAVWRNWALCVLWGVQAGLLLYAVWAPGDGFSRNQAYGPTTVDLPKGTQVRVFGLVVGCIVCQVLVHGVCTWGVARLTMPKRHR